uniref:Uncharacterized protein n=1 Tax=Poecilia latipinna TaxID=48699 RepID=A0A3B3VLH5_9TELE
MAFRGGASFFSKCDLRFADWMASLPQSMHTVPLANMAIPGRFSGFLRLFLILAGTTCSFQCAVFDFFQEAHHCLWFLLLGINKALFEA